MTSFVENYIKNKEFSWTVKDNPSNCNGKVVVIYNFGKPVMELSGYEILELFGKRFVEEHTKRCNSSYYLSYWNSAK